MEELPILTFYGRYMSKKSIPDVEASIEIMIEYKNGYLTKDKAILRFCYATGLTADIAEEFFTDVEKTNVILFPKKKPK